MTDRKISELVAVTSVDDADEFVLARSGSSNKITGANMGDSFSGSPPLVGWHAHWFWGGGQAVADQDNWSSTDTIASGVDFDTDGFANPDDAPFFVPKIPTGLGGMYLAFASFTYYAAAAGGYVAANIAGSSSGNDWAPSLYDDGTHQTLTSTLFTTLADAATDMDVTNFLNVSGHQVTLYRADYWGIRIGPNPV